MENDAAKLRYLQRCNMTSQPYTKSLIAKPCGVVDVIGESTLNDMFIKSVDPSIINSRRI